MKPLSAAELLSVWEQSLNQTMLNRMLILLTASNPELDFAEVASLSIGQRDTRLMELREWLFGSRLINTARCPQCSERVEWENDLSDIRIPSPPSASSLDTCNLEVAEYKLQFRLLNSMDIAEVMENILTQDCHSSLSSGAAEVRDVAEGGSASTGLLNRCIVDAKYSGKVCNTGDLPEYVLEALSRRITELDPQAEIRIDLTCPECSHRWEVLFDIAEFLWAEINAWAERMLQTVHRLASAYGWSEREILNLSPIRRQLYLGMVNS